MTGIVISIIALSLLIFFHELGHFLAARRLGVAVEVFSIGFGKTLYRRTVGATEYRISAVPLGGYVRMKGQDDSDPSAVNMDPDSYSALSPLRRILILLAGPLANFLIAFVLFVGAALMGMKALSPVVGKVLESSPAARAGLMEGDRLLQISGTPIQTWEDVSHVIPQSTGTLDVVVERDGAQKLFYVTPEILETENIFGEKVTKKMFGISPSGELMEVAYSFGDALAVGLDKTWDASKLIFTSVIKLIEGVVSPDNVGGVIAMVQFTSEASQFGIVALMLMTALISVNFGVLNLLPIPALDGGHIIFNLYEMITRRPPNENVVYKLTLGGWAILAGVMFLGFYNDINRLVAAP